MSDGEWVEETRHINFNSEVVSERRVNFLNQPGELELGKCIHGKMSFSARTIMRQQAQE